MFLSFLRAYGIVQSHDCPGLDDADKEIPLRSYDPAAMSKASATPGVSAPGQDGSRTGLDGQDASSPSSTSTNVTEYWQYIFKTVNTQFQTHLQNALQPRPRSPHQPDRLQSSIFDPVLRFLFKSIAQILRGSPQEALASLPALSAYLRSTFYRRQRGLQEGVLKSSIPSISDGSVFKRLGCIGRGSYR